MRRALRPLNPDLRSARRHKYDGAGRLENVKDWLEHTTKFVYDADGDLEATKFPSSTGDGDAYAYDDAGAVSEVKMSKGAETLASLAYTRNKDGGITKVASVGLPGEEAPTFSYDASRRLTKGSGVSYEYDEANDPTAIGSSSFKYDAADELEKAEVSKVTTATYTYDELGERTKTKPTTGPATTYTYDQAGNLIGVSRPKEGETAEIEDSYDYNGQGLRASQTIGGTTTYFAWDTAEKLPLILNDGTSSFIYGPGGLPIEQINNGSGAVLYLHHDEQGSTRLLTDSTGAKEASFTYNAYGNQTGHTGTATTPLGYDGQYTDSDTGLIYLRAREYDPATAQFLSVDPKVEQTGAVYTYAKDNPLSGGDPTGECPTASAASFRAGTKSECEGLLQKILTRRKDVLERVHALRENPNKLPLAEIKSHIKALKQRQANLRKLLKNFSARQCTDEWGLELPADVYQVIEIEVRVRVVPLP